MYGTTKNTRLLRINACMHASARCVVVRTAAVVVLVRFNQSVRLGGLQPTHHAEGR